MTALPNEPGAFAERVATLLKDLQPDFIVELTGPRELLVNGRRLDLENLFRMVDSEPERGEEIVQHFLEQLFTGDGLDGTESPWAVAKDRVMPRVQPESIFDHLSRELVAHVPFVNGTVIVFVSDLPNMTVSITTEQMVRWGVTIDDLEDAARANLDRYAESLNVQFIESREGGRAAVITEHDGYDAARVLMSDLYHRLAPALGGDFYVATPARDVFVAMSRGPAEFVGRMQQRIAGDYKRLPYPISDELFYVTRDGVAGTRGSLDMAA